MKHVPGTRRICNTRIALAAIAALGAVSAATALAFAAGDATTIRVGNLVLHAEAVVSPKALPKRSFAPIGVRARGSLETADGSHIPPIQVVHVQADKHIRFEATGLPSCRLGEIKASSPSRAMRVCGNALIGRGTATAEVAFPEQAPFSATGTLLGFNGPTVGGYPEMYFYAYVAVPAPTALVAVAKLSKGTGPFSYDIALSIPRIAGGSGSLKAFEVKIGRRWTYRGKRHSYWNAECPDDHFLDQFDAVFGDGTEIKGSVTNSCESKD